MKLYVPNGVVASRYQCGTRTRSPVSLPHFIFGAFSYLFLITSDGQILIGIAIEIAI